MVQKIYYNIIEFLKRIIGKEEVLLLEEGNKVEKTESAKNIFSESLKVVKDDRARILKLQRDIREEKQREENLGENDVILLKKLYCEQILKLTHNIRMYNKKLNT